MNSPPPPSCPHCGSHQLIAHQNSRRVVITHTGVRIPLLTANYHLDHPVIEERTTTYTCCCSWTGDEADIASHG